MRDVTRQDGTTRKNRLTKQEAMKQLKISMMERNKHNYRLREMYYSNIRYNNNNNNLTF